MERPGSPSHAKAVDRLAERARAETWTHEEFLAACFEREVAARQSNGGELRIRAARFPARKTLEEFDFDLQRSLRRDVIAHLGALSKCLYLVILSLDPTGAGRRRWTNCWKKALNAFDIYFDGRLHTARR